MSGISENKLTINVHHLTPSHRSYTLVSKTLKKMNPTKYPLGCTGPKWLVDGYNNQFTPTIRPPSIASYIDTASVDFEEGVTDEELLYAVLQLDHLGQIGTVAPLLHLLLAASENGLAVDLRHAQQATRVFSHGVRNGR